MMTAEYDSPKNLEVGDLIELVYDGGDPRVLEVEEITSLRGWTSSWPYAKCFEEDAAGRTGYMLPLNDPKYKWRILERVTRKCMEAAAVVYGAKCVSCGDWCPDAEPIDGFKCYTCRSTGR